MEHLQHIQHLASMAGHASFEVTAFVLSVTMFYRVIRKDIAETKAEMHHQKVNHSRMAHKVGKHD